MCQCDVCGSPCKELVQVRVGIDLYTFDSFDCAIRGLSKGVSSVRERNYRRPQMLPGAVSPGQPAKVVACAA